MTVITAYQNKFDLSATIALYDPSPRMLRRTFHLRNLSGDTQEACIQEASQIMTEVAREIRLITGVGIDKITFTSDGSKVHEEIVGIEPHEKLQRFNYALKISFKPVCTYRWEHERLPARWRVKEDEIADGWQRVLFVRHNRKAGFSLPCVTRFRQEQEEITEKPFVLYGPAHNRKGRKNGWIPYFNRNDPVLKNFLARFWENGNLALGEKRYFSTEGQTPTITGTFVPRPKSAPPEPATRSVLASQPKDDTDYVYIIRMGRKNIFKIGKSNDPQARLAALQTASPFKLSILNAFAADNASAAEENLHAALAEARLEGEWFRLTNGQRERFAAIEAFRQGKFVVKSRTIGAEELVYG